MRSLFSAVVSPAAAKAGGGVPSAGFIPLLGSMPSAGGVLVSQSTAMTVSAVYKAVRTRAQDVARCAPGIWKKAADGPRVRDKDHPVAKLFRSPNRVQTWFEFCEQMGGGLLLRGNAYAAIIRDRRGNPIELIPINPDAVMMLEASDGSLFYNVNRLGLWQIAMLRDFPTAIPAEDMFHLRGISFNALMAVSPIGLARDAVGVAMALEQQAARFVGNGARPSGVLKSPKSLTDEAAKRLKASWEAFTSGIQNTGRTAVLEDGVEWQQLQLTSVDLDFINQRNMQVSEIGRFFDVPNHKLGLPVDRGFNQVQADQDYVNSTIMPDLERWEQKIVQVFGIDPDEYEVDFDETRLLRADFTSRFNGHRIAILSGFKSPNEVRKDEGLAPVEGGDEVFRPLNMAALGSDMTGTAPDGAGKPADGELPADQVPTGSQPNGGPDDAAPID